MRLSGTPKHSTRLRLPPIIRRHLFLRCPGIPVCKALPLPVPLGMEPTFLVRGAIRTPPSHLHLYPQLTPRLLVALVHQPVAAQKARAL
jgi:hypothetical protein